MLVTRALVLRASACAANGLLRPCSNSSNSSSDAQKAIGPRRGKKIRPPELTLEQARFWTSTLSQQDRDNLVAALQALQAENKETQIPSVPKPSLRMLYRLGLTQALPFIGFGFLDNFIMIVAGEYIDAKIGVTLGISTMAAAALGNAISDVFGVGSAWYVEHWSAKLGVLPPPLTTQQLELPVARVAANAGRAGGVFVGCIIGMAPLLFT